MQIISIPNYTNNILVRSNNNKPSFEGRGKPITLRYVVEKRSHLLPERVLNNAREILSSQTERIPSLMELHKSIYAPLLTCNTLDEAKEMFPEFEEMLGIVTFERNSRYAKEFNERTDKNFALRMLQEFWVNLKTKDEIAQELGMLNRNSLEWSLKQIGFVSYPANYKTLLKASDEEGNRLIACKTIAWNALHPDLMYAKNKHAAQGCKTPEYREAQSDRMKAYDREHPERRQKIGESSREAWENCPEVKEAMSEFAKSSSLFVRKVVMKNIKGENLSPAEKRINKGFYKRFWDSHPYLKAVFADARNKNKSC